jgi:hypothetical protein
MAGRPPSGQSGLAHIPALGFSVEREKTGGGCCGCRRAPGVLPAEIFRGRIGDRLHRSASAALRWKVKIMRPRTPATLGRPGAAFVSYGHKRLISARLAAGLSELPEIYGA